MALRHFKTDSNQKYPRSSTLCGFDCAGKKKSTKEKRELRKAKKRDPADATVASARKPTPEELAAAGARLGPRAQVCCAQ